MDVKDLAQKHWEYVREVLIIHGTDAQSLEIIGFHYRSAMIHGYKHGQEDTK